MGERKRGRPPKDDGKLKTRHLRTSEEEDFMIEDLSSMDDISSSEAIRKAVRWYYNYRKYKNIDF